MKSECTKLYHFTWKYKHYIFHRYCKLDCAQAHWAWSYTFVSHWAEEVIRSLNEDGSHVLLGLPLSEHRLHTELNHQPALSRSG